MSVHRGEWWGDPACLPVVAPETLGGQLADTLVISRKKDAHHMMYAFKRNWIRRVRLYSSVAWTEDDRRATRIINDYLLDSDRDLLLCQDKLIDVGLERYARL